MSGLLSAGDNAIFQGETWLPSDIIHICVYSRLHSIESTDIAPCGCGRIQFHNLKGRSWNYIELWDPIYFYQKTKNKFEIKFPHFSLVFPWESIEKYTTRVHHTQDYLKTQYILQLLLRHCWWSKCWHDWYLFFIFIKFRLSTQADCGSEVFKLKWRRHFTWKIDTKKSYPTF